MPVYTENSVQWIENPTNTSHLNNKFIPNFKEKAHHFNAFFGSQCTPVSNNSALPPLVTTPVPNASLSSPHASFGPW